MELTFAGVPFASVDILAALCHTVVYYILLIAQCMEWWWRDLNVIKSVLLLVSSPFFLSRYFNSVNKYLINVIFKKIWILEILKYFRTYMDCWKTIAHTFQHFVWHSMQDFFYNVFLEVRGNWRTHRKPERIWGEYALKGHIESNRSLGWIWVTWILWI